MQEKFIFMYVYIYILCDMKTRKHKKFDFIKKFFLYEFVAT